MSPVPFGEKTAWWAFKTRDVDAMLKFLATKGLEQVRVCGWEDGVDASYDTSHPDHGNVLITPPIDGFVLVTSQRFLDWWADDHDVTTYASEWAEALGIEVQYFASERISGLAGWGRVTEDFSYRAFVKMSEEVLYQDGEITDAEKDAIAAVARDFASFGYADAAHLADRIADTRSALLESDPDGHELATIAALCTCVEPELVAARWSVDPQTLDERADAAEIPTTCWVGRLSFP